jgi:hypothetical protein
MSTNSKSFRNLLKCFPEINLPISLSSDEHLVFSRENKPIPQMLVEAYLTDDPETGLGEFEEYVACFRLPRSEQFVGLVYWKADLMEYQYILRTFDNRGEVIATQLIAGTKSNGETILRRVASFDEEGMILVAEGVAQADDRHYNAEETRNYEMEILPTGDILQMMNEN